MNESVGYTVTINIVITFIIIVFVFLSNVLTYYKSNKVGNLITDSIEKYSGFNDMARTEIESKLFSIGYNKTKISCGNAPSGCNDAEPNTSDKGYCVYYCKGKDDYYSYKIKTNMMINIPIINDIVNASVYSNTENLYDFKGVDKPTTLEQTIDANKEDVEAEP